MLPAKIHNYGVVRGYSSLNRGGGVEVHGLLSRKDTKAAKKARKEFPI